VPTERPSLRLVVRTPRCVSLETSAVSVRVPTETGQVGLRPGTEALVLAVEPGLVVALGVGRTHFVGTAGGLLRCDGSEVSLLTPLAVCGEDAEHVLGELEEALGVPTAELEARAMLERLEGALLRELRRGSEAKPPVLGDRR
jgi:F0F1-type ATP synthase epsilon subunit